MDLSSRVLLKNKNIDLFTSTKNAHIYQDDDVFTRVITNAQDIDKRKYELVIVDSYSTRSLQVKFKYLKQLPFVGMFGFYNGSEVNRVLFSFHRMNHLLGYTESEAKINAIAKTRMFISNKDKQLIDAAKLLVDCVAIVIGGEWDYRTYNNWTVVINCIQNNHPTENIVLVGSKNAADEERNILDNFQKNIISVVGKYSFNQTAQVIKLSKVLLCCDGGLMHAANSVNTPVIPLFARLSPEMQLTDTIENYALYDKNDVNNIVPERVVQQFSNFYQAQSSE